MRVPACWLIDSRAILAMVLRLRVLSILTIGICVGHVNFDFTQYFRHSPRGHKNESFRNISVFICQSLGDHEQATSVLLRRGADVLLVDELGKSAIDYARTRRILAMLNQCLPPLNPVDPHADGFPLKTQSFGKVPVTSSASPETSIFAEQNLVVGSRVSSAALPSSGDDRRISGLERSKSQEQADDVDRAQRGITVRLTGVSFDFIFSFKKNSVVIDNIHTQGSKIALVERIQESPMKGDSTQACSPNESEWVRMCWVYFSWTVPR